MAYLIIAEEGKKKKFEIKEDFVFIGQAPENQLQLGDPSIAKQHCQILRIEGGFRILDLGSESGTLVNGQKVKQVDLKEGDVIQIGNVKMAIKDVGPSLEPAGPPKPRPKAGASRRRSARTAGRSAPRTIKQPPRKEEKAPLKIKEEYAAASEKGGERLIRRQLRKGSKVPMWAQMVIGFWVVVVVIILAVVVYRQVKPSPWRDKYFQALNLKSQNQPELALQVMQEIPIEDPQWGDTAADKVREWIAERDAGIAQKSVKGAMEYFAHNIELFIHKFIDAPPEKPRLARTIKRDYKVDRKSYVRALILRRIDYYLETYSGMKDEAKVKQLRSKYVKEIDLNAPPDYRDIEVEADTELNLKHFGNAHQLIAGWLKEHPNTPFKDRIDYMMDQISGGVRKEWAFEEKEVTRKEGDGKYLGANRDLKRMIRLCAGYDTDEGRKLLDSWETRIAANLKIIEETEGVSLQTTVD